MLEGHTRTAKILDLYRPAHIIQGHLIKDSATLSRDQAELPRIEPAEGCSLLRVVSTRREQQQTARAEPSVTSRLECR